MNLYETDPGFMERFEYFALHEVVREREAQLDTPTRYLAILATLLGCGGTDEFRIVTAQALESGVSPIEVKEVVYQGTAYLGIGRTLPFLRAANEVLLARGVKLPLEDQSTTTLESRLQRGAEAQAEIFGEQMLESWKKGYVNRWLADNCFGDYYTRNGLTLAQREMITFCFLLAQGGCEPQLTAHARGNMNMGNDSAFLLRVIAQCLPYIGYPRSLNAVACVNKAAENA